jgi:hypothetical protein
MPPDLCPHLTTQPELNYHRCDLNLSKIEADAFGSRFHGWNLLKQNVKNPGYSSINRSLTFFSPTGNMSYCTDAHGLIFWHRSSTFNSNNSPTGCNNFSVYYPDVCLQLNMFRTFSRPSSGAQWLQWQPLVLPSYRGDSRAVFVVVFLIHIWN